jgi:hypothetical protein
MHVADELRDEPGDLTHCRALAGGERDEAFDAAEELSGQLDLVDDPDADAVFLQVPRHVVERGTATGDFRGESRMRGTRQVRLGMRGDRLEVSFGGRTERHERGARERDRTRAPADRIGESNGGNLRAQHDHGIFDIPPDHRPASLVGRLAEAEQFADARVRLHRQRERHRLVALVREQCDEHLREVGECRRLRQQVGRHAPRGLAPESVLLRQPGRGEKAEAMRIAEHRAQRLRQRRLPLWMPVHELQEEPDAGNANAQHRIPDRNDFARHLARLFAYYARGFRGRRRPMHAHPAHELDEPRHAFGQRRRRIGVLEQVVERLPLVLLPREARDAAEKSRRSISHGRYWGGGPNPPPPGVCTTNTSPAFISTSNVAPCSSRAPFSVRTRRSTQLRPTAPGKPPATPNGATRR